jgi:IS4 transposase
MKLRKPQAMQYQSTVFAQLLKALPRPRFDRIAAGHRSGRKKSSLPEWAHLVSMVLAQLSGSRSLRELERIVERNQNALSHLGVKTVPRSTLADANALRPVALFEEVAALLAGQMESGREMVRLIDATRIFAGKRIDSWSAGGAMKLHVMLDPESGRTVCFAVTSDRVNDITPAKAMLIEPGATYVFDKGYYDFGYWARLAAHGCRFVTRLKKNSPIRAVQNRALQEGCDNILADRTGLLSERLMSSRRNPYSERLRFIDVRIDSGRVLTLVTNDLDAAASEIAALYKGRWQIELFFKWIKQNLKLKRFLGTSANAIAIQILTALIAYLILRTAQHRNGFLLSLSAAAALVTSAILARRSLQSLLGPPPLPAMRPPQMSFAL